MALLQISANFVGVIIVVAYFAYFEPIRPITQINNTIVFVLIMFVGLVFVTSTLLNKWTKNINEFIQLKKGDQQVPPDLLRSVQRKILDLPYVHSLTSFFDWCLASLIISSYRILESNAGETLHETLISTPRVFIGIMISGVVTCAIVFFTLEIFCRRVWPCFFPHGGLAKIPGAFRLKLRMRMLAIFAISSILPMILMTVLSYNTARMMLVMNSEEVIRGLIYSTIFLLAVALVMAVILSRLLSASIVSPVHQMEEAMAKVEKGDLSASVPVCSNDELGALAENFNHMTEGLREGEVVKDAFSKYVAQEIRDEILSGRIPLDGEKKEVTILFSDLRNFTPMTESNDPKLVVKIMNSYFEEMAKAIQDQGGLVLQYIGDEIYAVFGAPVFRPDHPARAFRAGLEMRRRLVELNKQFKEKDWPSLRHGIGIHTGEALAANIGSPDRLSYLLVGDTVNLASRLQSLTKEVGAEMVLSAATHTHLPDSALHATEIKQLPPTRVKGKSHPVEIFAVA